MKKQFEFNFNKGQTEFSHDFQPDLFYNEHSLTFQHNNRLKYDLKNDEKLQKYLKNDGKER